MPSKSSLLKAFSKLSVLAVGGIFIWWSAPYDTFDAIMLFVLGLLFGPAFFDKSPTEPDLSPLLDWDEMHDGERVAHFLLEVFLVFFGILMTAMAVHTSRVETNWGSITAGIALICVGVYSFYEKWKQRYR